MAKRSAGPPVLSCSNCQQPVDVRPVPADAAERRPRIMLRSLPAMICPHCDSGERKGSKAIHEALATRP